MVNVDDLSIEGLERVLEQRRKMESLFQECGDGRIGIQVVKSAGECLYNYDNEHIVKLTSNKGGPIFLGRSAKVVVKAIQKMNELNGE